MTSRFVWIVLVAVAATVFPHAAFAQTTIENKTRLVFEIKNFQTITIPELPQIEEKEKIIEQPEPVIETPVKEAPKSGTDKLVPDKPKNYIPEKVALENRVYMHEPEIRAYICPKMGQKNCNIFIAVLKAENGTHECTRDNRGLNRNGSIDVGLTQINWNPKLNPPYTVEQLRDCKFNLDIALKKYESRGFQPWYAYTKGAYKKFLKTPAPVTEVAVAQ